MLYCECSYTYHIKQIPHQLDYTGEKKSNALL